MNRLLLLCLGVIVFGLICCTDKDKIPKGVLPKDKMESVLWDMIQAERFKTSFLKDSANLKAETFKLYAEVFAVHQVTKDQFVKSYKFYMSRPDIARDMFDSLASMANRRREDMYKAKNPQPSDSVKPKTTQPQPAQSQTPQAPPVHSITHPQPAPPPGAPQLTKPQPSHLPLKRLRIKNDSLLKHPK